MVGDPQGGPTGAVGHGFVSPTIRGEVIATHPAAVGLILRNYFHKISVSEAALVEAVPSRVSGSHTVIEAVPSRVTGSHTYVEAVTVI